MLFHWFPNNSMLKFLWGSIFALAFWWQWEWGNCPTLSLCLLPTGWIVKRPGELAEARLSSPVGSCLSGCERTGPVRLHRQCCSSPGRQLRAQPRRDQSHPEAGSDTGTAWKQHLLPLDCCVIIRLGVDPPPLYCIPQIRSLRLGFLSSTF